MVSELLPSSGVVLTVSRARSVPHRRCQDNDAAGTEPHPVRFRCLAFAKPEHLTHCSGRLGGGHRRVIDILPCSGLPLLLLLLLLPLLLLRHVLSRRLCCLLIAIAEAGALCSLAQDAAVDGQQRPAQLQRAAVVPHLYHKIV